MQLLHKGPWRSEQALSALTEEVMGSVQRLSWWKVEERALSQASKKDCEHNMLAEWQHPAFISFLPLLLLLVSCWFNIDWLGFGRKRCGILEAKRSRMALAFCIFVISFLGCYLHCCVVFEGQRLRRQVTIHPLHCSRLWLEKKPCQYCFLLCSLLKNRFMQRVYKLR